MQELQRSPENVFKTVVRLELELAMAAAGAAMPGRELEETSQSQQAGLVGTGEYRQLQHSRRSLADQI